MEFLMEWGLEIVLGLLSAGITGFFTYKMKEFKQKIQNYESLMSEKQDEKTEQMVEEKLEPIYEELEALRTYIRETESIEKVHMSLIIASYRFRLIQLCKEFIRQGYLTQNQYDQLSEFYRVYEGLGGNGQAKDYYDRTIALEIRNED